VKAVILAGGLGTRLRPFTEVIPKPLLPVGDKSIMEIQIRMLERHGFDEIYVAVNHMADLIEAFFGNGAKLGVRLKFSREEKPLGTAGPLSLLKDELKQPFIVVNGDILTKLDFSAFYRFALAQDSILTIATKIIKTPFRFGSIHIDQNGFVADIEEKPEFQSEILAGIHVMKPAIFQYIGHDQPLGMDQLIEKMLGNDQRISRYLIQEFWMDIGQLEDYTEARDVYSQEFQELFS
jgi:NDP-sugar pyrophosphorylase family protein